MFPDMTKFMNVEEFTKAFQSGWNMDSAINSSKESMDAMQQASTVMAETWSTCLERQMQMAQSSMQESVDAMKDLAASNGVEDLMNKQGSLARKTAEQAQANGQELAQVIQSGQTKVMDLMSKQVMKTLDTTSKACK